LGWLLILSKLDGWWLGWCPVEILRFFGVGLDVVDIIVDDDTIGWWIVLLLSLVIVVVVVVVVVVGLMSLDLFWEDGNNAFDPFKSGSLEELEGVIVEEASTEITMIS